MEQFRTVFKFAVLVVVIVAIEMKKKTNNTIPSEKRMAEAEAECGDTPAVNLLNDP